MSKEERFHLRGLLLQVGSENLWNKLEDGMHRDCLPCCWILEDGRGSWTCSLQKSASFIPQFPLHLGRSFRVAAVNSSFTPANRIILESPVVGLFLAVWIQHSPVVTSLRKRGRIEKAAGAHTATGISISIHEFRLQEQSPRDSRVTLMSPAPA